MKITEDVRKYAAEQGIAEEEALKRGMEAVMLQMVFTRSPKPSPFRKLYHLW
jgi:hypothetical protein